jgi:predicted enzyme related to lactoylglutathione lyase
VNSEAGLVIYAKDLRIVASFYEHVLGLVIVEADDTYVVMRRGGIELVVLAIPDEIANDVEITSPPRVREETPLKPVFFIDDRAVVRAAVVSNGGSLKPVEAEWSFRGTIVIDGCDPEGNVIQFRQHA